MYVSGLSCTKEVANLKKYRIIINFFFDTMFRFQLSLM